MRSGVFTFAAAARYDGQWSHNASRGRHVRLRTALVRGEWARGKMRGRNLHRQRRHRWTGQFYNGQGPGLEALL